MRSYLKCDIRTFSVLAGAFALASCRQAVEPVSCDEAVGITVSNAPTPVFSWTPACTVGSLMVEKLEPTGQRRLLWLAFDESNAMRSRIPYGSRGSPSPAPALELGSSYRVSVGVIVGGDAIFTLGTRDFSR